MTINIRTPSINYVAIIFDNYTVYNGIIFCVMITLQHLFGK